MTHDSRSSGLDSLFPTLHVMRREMEMHERDTSSRRRRERDSTTERRKKRAKNLPPRLPSRDEEVIHTHRQ